MDEQSNKKNARPISPNGEPLTLANLPDPSTKRWVVRRKAEVVAAVRGGLLTAEEACERYGLSTEEFESWRRLIEKHGLRGLRVTRLRDYTQPNQDKDPLNAMLKAAKKALQNSNAEVDLRVLQTDNTF